jgi:putative flippase GtrA
MPDKIASSQTPAPGALRREVTGFALVGAAGFVTDSCLTVLFVHLGLLPPFLARLPATAIAICVTFLLNRRWTFRSRDTDRIREFARYLGVSIGGASINYGFYILFLTVAHATGIQTFSETQIVFAAVVTGAAAAVAFNFLGSRYLAFVHRAGASADA